MPQIDTEMVERKRETSNTAKHQHIRIDTQQMDKIHTITILINYNYNLDEMCKKARKK